ncbi:DUF4465 domain-containing protein [Blastopirellula marina]|uniref:PEP-CTERM sorting domain-containing protein n=1 Tax=Blastopirellula marina TaxID=124 RepID=A0A2S8G8T7_9BACT|nr:DUF4465 domain-containing protein [Blastopirellula marina]PQO40843.1 PEP-CTERM sorting domain-containing protein [Blastopirellula marina]PTL45725.1 DUF4465 domain-containing protein [Blastopirellula marina]
MRIIATLFIALFSFQQTQAAIVVDFESLPLGSDGYNSGDIGADAAYRSNYTVLGSGTGPYGDTVYSQVWTSEGVEFSNSFSADYGSWSGWSLSNVVDTTTAGYLNQFAAYAGGGSDGAGGTIAGGQYAVGFGSGYINLPGGTAALSMDITNATYAGLSMEEGDFFSKAFGGESGNDPDYFRVILSGFDGLDGTGNEVGSLVVNLADFTFDDNSQDYILSDWVNVDLTALGSARSITFDFESSDSGAFGINTPVYFAMDNLTLSTVPEPSMLVLLGSFAAVGGAIRGYKKRKQTGLKKTT